jgi:hypothetical protein
MAQVSIDQRPLYKVLPIGQQIMFSVSETNTVATKYKVKFVAEVYVSNIGITYAANELIGTFKTTPNNAGVGIFNLRPILESFVSPDNEPSSRAEYKLVDFNVTEFPIHLIDKFSISDRSIKFFAVRFLIEYADSPTEAVGQPTDQVDSTEYTFFNGVLQYDDVLTLENNNYGYDLNGNKFFLVDDDSKFLTNAPTTQYARLTDYGTLPFLNYFPTLADRINGIFVKYYDSAGSTIAGTDQVVSQNNTGGSNANDPNSNSRLSYFGAFPGNLQNWSTNFATAIATGNLAYYTVQAQASNISQIYRINILCDNLKGFEPIRLTWLNQWGVWDYYTFNMKSTRTIATNRTSYTQMSGTWNDSTFKISDYKGGKKNFRVNSTEKIKLNTDFVTEAEGLWFEELINSTEVYIVNGYEDDVANTITNKYIEPVVLTTSSYVKKTIANDKLMQYTIEIEKSKMQRTQSV